MHNSSDPLKLYMRFGHDLKICISFGNDPQIILSLLKTVKTNRTKINK